MTIRLKVAQSSQELEDLYKLRAQVYAEQGYFTTLHGNRRYREYLVDRFDTYPYCANIVAYNDKLEQIGTLRINMYTGNGLPADEYFDFAPHRQEISEAWKAEFGEEPRVVCAGMLAVRKQWRRHNEVIRSLFKMAGSIARGWDITHVIATVNFQNRTMYERIGFKPLSEQIWIEEIGEHVVPMAVLFEQYYQWAVGDLPAKKQWISPFFTQHQRLVVKAGEYIFKEGDRADEAYLIDDGCIKIFRHDGQSQTELMLTLLRNGDIFGELALIDAAPRSASAVAVSNSELLVLRRDEFNKGLDELPSKFHDLLHVLSGRLRRMDEFATVLVSGSDNQRLQFALERFREAANEDSKHLRMYTVKAGPVDLAQFARVSENHATQFLNELVSQGLCEFDGRQIRFSELLADQVPNSSSWEYSSS
ncbi:MAG: cyclic nucleotide-binding domain-containing protein [Gallionella sp.]